MESRKMSADPKLIFASLWRRNEEWYTIDREKDRFVLTDKATPMARESFERWKELNNLHWD